MKKRYRVSWTEKHSVWIEADNEDQAVEDALMDDMAESCESQSVDYIEEGRIEPEYDQLLGDR